MKAPHSVPLVLVVAGLIACGGGDGTGPVVTSVVVSPAEVTLNATGSTQQFLAQARTSGGRPVTGQTVSWTTSDTTVATVDASGIATAVAAGSTAVRATIDGVAGSSIIDVTAPALACADATTVSLAPGGWQAYPLATCLLLPSGASGDRYRVAVTRPTQVEDASDVPTVTLNVTGLGVAASPPVAAGAPARTPAPLEPIPGLSAETLRRSMAMADATSRYEENLRANEQRLAGAMTPADILPPDRQSAAQLAPAPADLPAKLTFQPATPSDCRTGVTTVTGILVHQNADMAIYQDSTQRVTEPITEAQATRMTDYFSTYAKGMVEAYFGQNPDVDGNGKEIVFATPVVTGDIAAWVWSGNYFSKESCPASNGRDLIFFNTDLIRSMDDESPNWQALETVSHESKHVVSLYNRLAYGQQHLDSSPYHPLWIEEGTAEVSGNMSSRIAWAAKGGPPVGARITRDDFVKAGVTPEDYGVLLRMARTVWYLSSQPNGLIVAPRGAIDGSNVYASGWHFERWLGDAYGHAATPMADATFYHAMNDSLAAKGGAGLTERTGKSFYELFDEFVAAICLEGTGAPAPERGFTSYDFVSATQLLQDQPPGQYPWPVTTTGPSGAAVITKGFQTAAYSGPIGATGIRIHDFVSNGTGTGARVTVSMPPPGRIVVVRIH